MNGINFLQALTLIFIVLKLIGYVTFNWWIVWTPLIIHFLFVNVREYEEFEKENNK